MKTLVSCTPEEFLTQTYKIKTSVSKWLTGADILNIRKRMPEGLVKVSEITSEQDKEKVLANNKKLLAEQSRKNLNAILDAVLVDHPKETLEVLALICFIEPEDVNNHKMHEYLVAVNEILNDEAVIGFFTSLARLGLTNTQNVSTI